MTYTDVTSWTWLCGWYVKILQLVVGLAVLLDAGWPLTPLSRVDYWRMEASCDTSKGHFGALNQLPQHNPSQRWSQSSQRSPSLIITYSLYITERDHCPPAKQVKLIDWLILWLRSKKSVKMESEIYLTKQTLISWLSALIPWCFSSWSFTVYITALFFQALFSSFPSSSAHTDFPRWPNEHAGQ